MPDALRLHLGYSPVTRQIYIVRLRTVEGVDKLAGKQVDYTAEALSAAYRYLMDAALEQDKPVRYGVQGEGYIQWHRGERA